MHVHAAAAICNRARSVALARPAARAGEANFMADRQQPTSLSKESFSSFRLQKEREREERAGACIRVEPPHVESEDISGRSEIK